jgi:anti-anti-sigma regulatory factor
MKEPQLNVTTKDKYPKKIEISIDGHLCGAEAHSVAIELIKLVTKIPENILINLKNLKDIDQYGIMTLAKIKIAANELGVRSSVINYDKNPKSSLIDLSQSNRVLLF